MLGPMNWFLLSISAALCWAAGSTLVKKGFETVPPLWNNIINNALTILVYIPAAFILTGSRTFSFHSFFYVAAASLLYQIFYYAISKGQISLTGTLVAGYPIFTILLAYIFISERLLLLQYIAVALVILGGIIIALPSHKRSRLTGASTAVNGNSNSAKNEAAHGETGEGKKHQTWILWGITGAAFLGTGDFFAKFAIDRDGIFSYLIIIVLISNLYSGLNYAVDVKNRPVPKNIFKNILPTFSGLLLNLFGFVFLLLAFSKGKASLVAPVSSVYPAITVTLAVRFLKEKVSLFQGFGIAFIVLGLIAVGITAG